MAKESLFKQSTNAEVEAANEIYKVAQASAKLEVERMKEAMEAVRLESQATGILKKIEYDQAHNEFIKYVVLMRLRDSKDYKKGGLTWEQFCDQVLNESHRNVNRTIAEIRPLVDQLSDKMSQIIGVPFNKIRYLGREIGTNPSQIKDGVLIIDDIEIPLTPENKDDIEAAIDALKEAHQKKIEDREATIKAKDRILENKEKLINKQEKALAVLEQRAAARGMTASEEAFIQHCDNARITIDGFFAQYDPEINPLPEDHTPRMRAALMETLGYFYRVVEATFNTAAELYGNPELDDDWVPPHLRPAEGDPAPDCGACEWHKAMSNPKKGVKIPGQFGKCSKPGGLCRPEADFTISEE